MIPSNDFYPRSPCGERLRNAEAVSKYVIFLSTLSLRRATLRVLDGSKSSIISIHALLAESDSAVVGYNLPFDLFLSTLSLRRATNERWKQSAYNLFLSTLSLRRATRTAGEPARPVQHFYPRSPCGERPCRKRPVSQAADFYPRSPCGERPGDALDVLSTIIFLSTLSLRRATMGAYRDHDCYNISIHALLAESDASSSWVMPLATHFYPRSPCGERLGFSYFYIIKITISIHALLAESDNKISAIRVTRENFYPRSPCGERRGHDSRGRIR